MAEPTLESLDSLLAVTSKLEALDWGQRTQLEESLLNTKQALAIATRFLGIVESNQRAAAELLGKFEDAWERVGDWDGDGGEQILAREVRAGLARMAGRA